jgi:GNAT superfamily N-acetyltransferase
MSAVDWVKLELHLGNVRYDEPLRLPERMSITTLAVLGDTSANRRRIYQLNKACSADIPGRGQFFSYEEYAQRRFAGLGFRPDGQVLLLDGDAMVGLCALSLAPGRDWAFIEMTGILRPYRRRGLATDVKRYAIEQARTWGATTIRTVNHPTNRPIIDANRKLGFHEADFDLG